MDEGRLTARHKQCRSNGALGFYRVACVPVATWSSRIAERLLSRYSRLYSDFVAVCTV